jgi:uncharacterized metal-binding protein YceD (DUF177 family)
MTGPAPPAEFARLIDIARLPPGEAVFEIAANAVERMALARRFDLLALDRLEARVRLSRLPAGFVRLAAEVAADVVQACVVTLEPVASKVEEEFTLSYGAGAEPLDGTVLSGEAEIIEPFPADCRLDIGEVVAQQLSLALDPFPHAPGAEIAGSGEAAADSPFAALANRLKKG